MSLLLPRTVLVPECALEALFTERCLRRCVIGCDLLHRGGTFTTRARRTSYKGVYGS